MKRSDGKHPDLCRQLAGLILSREQMESRLIQGEIVDALDHSRLVGAINRTMTKLKIVDENEREKRERMERENAEAMLPS